jgi:hypothetical protein
MNLVFVDKKGDPQIIKGFECISDDDEWLTMTIDGKKKAINKCDIFDRTYVICTDEVKT